MTDRPIIFSAPMVNAILSGRKSMTRRILKPQPPEGLMPEGMAIAGEAQPVGARWSRGDRLWVREAFRGGAGYDAYPPREWSHWPVSYEADPLEARIGLDVGRLRPSIHMPRWASRLTLIVTDVRVQRLQDISNEDAIAEGTEPHGHAFTGYGKQSDVWMAPYYSFAILWTSIHGPDAWDANPWVAAISFETHKCNIDQMPGGDHE